MRTALLTDALKAILRVSTWTKESSKGTLAMRIERGKRYERTAFNA
ncbi:hypothetical protein HY492_01865 [Candidatus Woesearchaeota archaeon]|nr:hypothetical protein [Candidatus Woesearchaeota archaeon]